MDKLLIARVFSHIATGHVRQCWPWTTERKDGYGSVQDEHGKRISAHRVVYEFFHGDLSPDEVVRHTCDNPPCCNPYHLVKGTQADNVRDRVERRRSANGVRNGRALLGEDDVRSIHKDNRTLEAIAADYGVSRATIYDIKSGRNWKHIAKEFGVVPIPSASVRNK
jgi:hypothetical protein